MALKYKTIFLDIFIFPVFPFLNVCQFFSYESAFLIVHLLAEHSTKIQRTGLLSLYFRFISISLSYKITCFHEIKSHRVSFHLDCFFNLEKVFYPIVTIHSTNICRVLF